MIRSCGLVVVGSIAIVCPAGAQLRPHLTVGATLAGVTSTARDAGGRQVSDGFAVGGVAALRAGLLSLSAEYGEGSLRAKGATNDRTLVQGAASAALQLNPWLSVGATVAARRLVETDPERWLAWGAIARVEVPIIGQQGIGIAQFRQGLGGEVNLTASGVRAQDGQLGLVLALPDHPYWIELATRVESYSAGGETRTLEQFGVSVGWRGP
jgi:hypothetical protein